MTEFKHTPAPWNIFRQDDDMIIAPFHLSKRNFAIASIDGGNGIEEDEANAKLIAAAPELLEALQNLTTAANMFLAASGEEIYNNQYKHIEKALEAIKKATE